MHLNFNGLCRRRWLVFAAILLCAIAVTAYWWGQGRPVALVDAPSGRVSCVSYAPSSEHGESLLDEKWMLTAEHIERDLSLLAQRFDCVRTYSQSNGLDQVPRIAHRLGMQTILGIWLSRDPVTNELEIRNGIKTALRDREAIRAIVVGNEVLLRGELQPEVLAAFARRVRLATGLPVTYADVWEFWRRHHAVIAPAVSFVTIHILPYWEDEPVTVATAVAHVRDIYAQMVALFPGKPILIGETGWPSAGRQRRGAVPSRVNQARFIREFLNFTAASRVPYNVIEAFDQPWKRRLEGTVGGYWGQFDRARRPKFPLQGAFAETPHWYYAPLAGLGLAALFLIYATVTGKARVGAPAMATFLISIYTSAAVLFIDVQRWYLGSRNPFEWALGAALLLTAAVSTLLLTRTLGKWMAGGPPILIPSAAQFRHPDSSGRWLGVVRFVWLLLAAVLCLLLVYDPRYRDFPNALFAPVTIGFALIACGAARTGNPAIEERLMSGWLMVAAVAIVVIERPQNTSAVLWATLCVILGLVTRLPKHQDR